MSKAVLGELRRTDPKLKPVLTSADSLTGPMLVGAYRGPVGSGRVLLLAHSNLVSKPGLMRPAIDWMGIAPGTTIWSNDLRRGDRIKRFLDQRNPVRITKGRLRTQRLAPGELLIISPFNMGKDQIVEEDVPFLIDAVKTGTHVIVWCIGWVQRDVVLGHPVNTFADAFGRRFGKGALQLKSELGVFSEDGKLHSLIPIETR